nr:PREDICTED: pentatricopeptide repeat-containing protein At1g19525-like [Daucus carota subsp. sativus]
MLSMGHKADDRSTASMIAAYETKNLLDKALDLLLQLEKDGFEPGVATYSVLVDWFGQLQLVEEAEDLLSKITELGEAPPLKLHISLCDMYLKAGIEKKALQALGVIESKKDQLNHGEFERVIRSLINGGFAQDAKRVQGLMETRGFTASDQLKVHLMAIETLNNTKRPTWSKPMLQVKR